MDTKKIFCKGLYRAGGKQDFYIESARGMCKYLYVINDRELA